MREDFDIVIAGGGHNSLVCACLLARAGLSVMVAEKNEWIGGGAVTKEVTLPGFRHDISGDSHIWIHANRAFTEFRPELERYGLKYVWGEDTIEGHPLPEGPGIVVRRDIDLTCDSIAEYSRKDARRYREIYEDFLEIKDGFVEGMFSPPRLPSAETAALEKTPQGLRTLYNYRMSARAFTEQNFENPHVRSFILGWAMGPQITPDQDGGARTCYIMIPGVHVYGQAVPQGGSMRLPEACARYLEDHGGQVLTGSGVAQFIVSNGECRGVRLDSGDEILAKRAVVSGLDARQTFLDRIDEEHLSGSFLSMVRSYQFGNVSAFRIYYALNEAPEFASGAEMNRTDFQRIFGPTEETVEQFAELTTNRLPQRPFLHTLCFSRRDPTRAPPGKHALTMDTFVPSRLASGDRWPEIQEAYARLMLERLREFTTNMDDGNILAYALDTPETIAASNASYVDGTASGGAKCQTQTGYFRPFPGYSHYKSPIRNLYLTGPSCHPGDGISAMGTITANVMLEDFGLKAKEYHHLETPREWRRS